MDWTDFAVLLLIYMLGFGAIYRSTRKIDEQGGAAIFIIVVYSLVLMLATIYAIATHYLPLWAILLAALLCSIPFVLNHNK